MVLLNSHSFIGLLNKFWYYISFFLVCKCAPTHSHTHFISFFYSLFLTLPTRVTVSLCLTGAIVCVWEISVSSCPSVAAVTPDCSVQVNWKPSTAAGSSACWDILQRNVESKVPLTCWKSAVRRSGRSTTFLPTRRRSDTNKKAQNVSFTQNRCTLFFNVATCFMLKFPQ